VAGMDAAHAQRHGISRVRRRAHVARVGQPEQGDSDRDQAFKCGGL